MAYDPKKDYSFEDVPELIGYLKRSAIDAYMIVRKLWNHRHLHYYG